ncbi:MAG: DUF3325 domain-containing protein [Pseudomonadota bacterium]
MYVLVFLLLMLGLVALCLSMNRHHRQVFSTSVSASRQRLLRLIGYPVLILSAIVAVNAYGVGLGLTLYTGLFTVAMLLCAFTMTFLGAKKS